MLEVDGAPISVNASLRHFRGGHAGRVADALLQPLLLPSDLAAYRTCDYPDLLFSLKRDLAMVSRLTSPLFICISLLRPKTFFLLRPKTFFLLCVTGRATGVRG